MKMVYEGLIAGPAFGITLSFIAYSIGLVINKKTRSPLANPLAISATMIIGFLVLTNIDFEYYHEGGKMIEFLLGPATVSLGIPLYKNLDRIKKNLWAILSSIFVGTVSSIVCTVVLSKVLGADEIILRSIASKSVTTPIAIEVTRIIGGIPSLTVVFVMISGIIGAMIGPEFCRWIGIKTKSAMGLAIGSSAHGIGTSRAIQEGDEVGAMSSLGMGLMGVCTAVLAPVIVNMLL